MELIDFDEIIKELEELKEIVEQEKRHQQQIKNELYDMEMRLSIIQQQIRGSGEHE